MADIQNALPFFDAQVRALGDRAIVRLDFAVFCPTAPVSCELEQKFLFLSYVCRGEAIDVVWLVGAKLSAKPDALYAIHIPECSIASHVAFFRLFLRPSIWGLKTLT